MFQRLDHRPGHYLLLTVAWAALCLPNLGGPSLWDVDEGRNAQAAQEMLESGNWIVPSFNYQMRADKPPLLYWLQMAAYTLFGVSEFSARLPSALAALLAVLALYELGRRTFGASAALLAGVILASSVSFCGAAHFANPDSLLNAFCLLSLLFFWADYPHGGRSWWIWRALSVGVAVLAKGPVGLLLPSSVVFVFLLWERRLWRLVDTRLLWGVLAFLLVAAPWYVWVGLETHGRWLVEFWCAHHQDRFLGTLENHGGPIFYYLLVLLAGLAPWSIFVGLVGWHCHRDLHNSASPDRSAVRFLVCWLVVYLLFFSLAGTKLPNYILPLYPAMALLTARFLDQWRRGLLEVPAWTLNAGLIGLALVGVGLAVGLLIVGGALHLPFGQLRLLPGLRAWAWLGAIPIGGAAVAGWYGRRVGRDGFVGALVGCTLLFTATLAAFGGSAVEKYKAARELARALPADQLHREVRVAALGYFQPSLVFYCQREVQCLNAEQEAVEFLRQPLPSFLLTPADEWERLRPRMPVPCRILNRRYDLYTGSDIVLVSNERQ